MRLKIAISLIESTYRAWGFIALVNGKWDI